MRSLLVVLHILTLVSAAKAAGAPVLPADVFTPGDIVEIEAVLDARTVRLTDGRELRLLGVDVPERMERETMRALTDLVLGQPVRLFYGEVRSDRWQRMLAHVATVEGTWVQGALLSAGLARVYTVSDNRLGADAMLTLERDARAVRSGLWEDPAFRVRPVAGAGKPMNAYQIVEGVVMDAAKVRGRVYLNFGPDWKTDFTILVPAGVRRQFEGQEIDLLALEGKTVRVRGWIRDWNGPLIELSHPEQLEVPSGPANQP